MFFESLSTPRSILRPVRADDATSMFDGYTHDADVTRFLTWRPHLTVEETRIFVQMCLCARTSRTYVIVDKASGSIAGVADLRAAAATRVELGYALAAPFWGQGIMTEVLAEIVRWTLGQPAIWRIGAVVDIENVGSMRALEKAGFRREGVLRRWSVHPNISDTPRDCASFAATR